MITQSLKEESNPISEVLEGGTVPLKEKISYGMLDTAGQFVFTMITSYLLYFYTDVAGIAVATAGTILLAARIVDAIDVPIWGIIIDKTNTKWGKSRPYFLWMAIPLGVMGALTFWAPELTPAMKVVYASGTYILTGIIYTGINTPLTSILPSLTSNPKERIVLNSYRMFGSLLGVFIVNSTALSLISFFGQGNDKKGFVLTVSLFAVVSIALNLIGFLNIRERNRTAKEVSLPIKKSLAAAKGNWPWVIIVVSNFLFWIGFTARSSTLIYYFTYNLTNKHLVSVMNGLISISIVSIVLIPFFLKGMSKRNVWLMGLTGAVGGQLIIYLAGTNLTIVTIGWIVANLGSGIAISLPFAMLGSAVDFGQWKTGIQSAGFLTAIGSSFCIKAGSGLGAFIPSIIMGSLGYKPDTTQTEHGLLSIQLAFIGVPVILFFLAMIPLFFYSKYEKMENHIISELNKTSNS
jgi:sugar (glycoside-pentoside-hexuronide) transporter